MRDRDFSRIAELPLFEGLSAATLHDVAGAALLHRYPARTTLVAEGDPMDFVHVLFEGRIELNGAWKDRETTLAVLQPVATFGLAAAVLDAPALMGAVTVERSEILMIPAESLRRTMAMDGEFAVRVARELAGCYRGVVRATKSQKLRNGTERVASWLWARRARENHADRITLPFEKRLLASLLDMTPETLSRALVALKRYGVEVHGQEIAFTNTRALARIVRPTPLIDNEMPAQTRPIGKAELELWSAAAIQAQSD